MIPEMASEMLKFSTIGDMEKYIRQKQFEALLKDLTMTRIPKVDIQKRTDDSIAEILRVVSDLKTITSAHAKLIEMVVNTVSEKNKKDVPAEPKIRRISDVPFGHSFKRPNDMYCIRCRPTSYLLNSTLVSESLSAGKQLVMNHKEGTVFFVENEIISA